MAVGAVLGAVLAAALSRAELLERFKAPVLTQADGLVRVYAFCPEDLRRDYQMPIARFAAETVEILYRGAGRKPVRHSKPGIVIHVGDVRTNLAEVVTRVATNDGLTVSHVYVKSPAFADLRQLRLAIVRGFYRCVEGRELDEAEAERAYRMAHPALRADCERQRLEDWLGGRGGVDDEEGLRLMRKVIEPGKASRRDVLTFASRLFLYPPTFDLRFMAKYDCLSFGEAVRLVKTDPAVSLMAARKAACLPAFGSGRGKDMTMAVCAYETFLLELAKNEKSEEDLRHLLYEAEEKLNVAFEKAR